MTGTPLFYDGVGPPRGLGRKSIVVQFGLCVTTVNREIPSLRLKDGSAQDDATLKRD